ncbi:hypothetical protein QBC47DRAFT_360174 [Echria macrotheca]|uniref:DUF8021 domain-containing protein n=1 Tax=Echria macrotheca TaxID=438768 RepID=A0AAJ0BDW4_9PEZI|nr:hypothetical protein QBC47DRAFT_360174 [Echria macrotheca]
MLHRINLLLALASTASAVCNESTLRLATDRYVASQTTGSLQWLGDELSNGTTYLENGKAVALASNQTAFSLPLRVDYRQTIFDTTQCASFTSLVDSDAVAPRVIGAQLWLVDDKVTKIDRIVTTPGDWLFNATGTLYYSLREDWGVIPPEKRDSRATIKAAADAYFDVFKNASVPVPWGTPCARLEGGAYTGRGLPTDSCNVGVIQSFDMPNRRYVIDETVGAVSVFVEFGSIGNAPDSHLFRVEGGRLRFIHTMTYCEKKPNCGFSFSRPGAGGAGIAS